MNRSVILARPLGLADVVRYGQLADSLAYDRIWLAETNGPDATVAAGMLAASGQRADLGTAVVSVYTRSAPVLAMAAATVAVASGRTFRLGIGAGGQAVVEQWHGVPFEAPVARVRDAVSILRQSLAGDRTDVRTPHVASQGFRLHEELRAADVRVYVAALGPKMLEMAGAVADGVLLTWVPTGHLAEVVRTVRQAAAAAGRDPMSVDVVSRLLTAVTDDPAVARERLRAELPFYLASGPYNRFFASMGFADEAAAFTEAFARGDREGSREAISDAMVDGLLVAGDASVCRAGIDAAHAAGADDVMVAPFVELGDRVVADTLEGCAP